MRVRDRECRTPGCYRPTQVSELDHSTDWHKHGTTTEKRLIGLCRHHHTLKDHPERTYTANDTDGTYTITTPTGHQHTNRPQPLHKPHEPPPIDE